MEMESLLSSTKWEILEQISTTPSSPLQLAKKLNTTVANISIQLKLLEAAGIVAKEKTGKAKAGRPRHVYSLNKEFTHLTTVSKDATFKKTIPLQPHQKASLLIWNSPKALQGFLLKFLYNNEHLFSQDVFLEASASSLTLWVMSDKEKTESHEVTFNQTKQTITLRYTQKQPKQPTNQICFG